MVEIVVLPFPLTLLVELVLTNLVYLLMVMVKAEIEQDQLDLQLAFI